MVEGVINAFLRYHRSVAARQTILIVEDDLELRRMYRTALAFAGYDTIEAEDGLSALQHLEEKPPDLVILDLMLPTISGLMVQQEIAANAHTRNIPIVVVTASEMDLGALDVPCVLRKPVSPDRLIDSVRSCLKSGAPGAQS